jgi:pyridoxamine 5'-phosphate oxidase-like protein
VPEAARPSFPGVYGIHDDEAGLLPWNWAAERLARARNYWVTTTTPAGSPHAMPVWGVWLDDAFYFSTSPHSRKARNLASNPATVVHLESGDDVVILEGHAAQVTDGALLGRLSEDYSHKYELAVSFSVDGRPLFALRPQVAYAWQERDYPATATRFEFPTPGSP